MATRTIQNPRDRFGDDHDRAADDVFRRALPGIRADHRRLHPPNERCGVDWNYRGVVLFALYIVGSWRAPMAVGLCAQAQRPEARAFRPLMLELPAYHWPNLRWFSHWDLWQRVEIFMSRVGTIILSLMVILWALSSFPAPPPGATRPGDPIQHRRTFGRLASRAVRAPSASIGRSRLLWCRDSLRVRFAVGPRWAPCNALSATGDDVSGALDTLDRPFMEFCRTAPLSARVVRICAPVLVDPCYGQTRNQFLALPRFFMAAYLFAMGLRRFVDYLSGRHGTVEVDGGRARMNSVIDDSLVGFRAAGQRGIRLVYRSDRESLRPRPARGPQPSGGGAARRRSLACGERHHGSPSRRR